MGENSGIEFHGVNNSARDGGALFHSNEVLGMIDVKHVFVRWNVMPT